MAGTNAIWGIDVGQCALKAIKLRPAGDGQLEVVAFDVVEHAKILSQPDADRDELIRESVKKFASRNDIRGDKFVVGVPGQQTFARFCKMPPIDLKKDARRVHDLVKYEAGQQIPFDMNDVVWDYQIFASPESPDIEVGIFAIRKDLIRKHLSFFADAGIAPVAVQAIPAALYNFAKYDLDDAGEGGATVLIDVGAQNTDLIIVEPNSAWTRNIPLGGNSFTETLVRSFKLSFAKAENLKRTAADSKYARQIFQAMRPVFAELVAEIQRSIGFYSSTHRGVELKRVYALGNAFHLPGLQKYLENNLQAPGGVIKLERFSKLAASATTENPTFTSNVLTFTAAYGLALQGLGLAKIGASLLPTDLARLAAWQKKRPYFVAAAACFALAAVVPYAANALDLQRLKSASSDTSRARTAQIVKMARDLKSGFQKATGDTSKSQTDIDRLLALQKDRYVLARLVAAIHDALPTPQPPELATVSGGEALRKLIASDKSRFDRKSRGQFLIESLEIDYKPEIDSEVIGATPPGGGGVPLPPGAGGPGSGRGGAQQQQQQQQPQAPGAAKPGTPPAPGKDGFVVRVQGRLLYGTSPADASRWLDTELFARLRETSSKPGNGFFIPATDPPNAPPSFPRPTIRKAGSEHNQGGNQPGGPITGPTGSKSESGALDPTTGEDASNDWLVSFAFKVKRGEPPPPPQAAPNAPGQPNPQTPPGGGRQP